MSYLIKEGDKDKITMGEFLLENMDYHGFYDGEILEDYFSCIENLNKSVVQFDVWTTNNVITLLNTETTKNPMKMLFKIQENTIFQQRKLNFIG